jgi:Alkylmercury lyase
MSDPAQLDSAFDFVLRTFAQRGTAPHYTELGAHFGLGPEGGRQLLHDLVGAGIPAWLHPDTDLIASFAPFNNLPTHYRILVDGQPKGYAQCGFEVLALCWIFPGREVTVEAPCLDCGEPLRLAMRDGELLRADPPQMVGYIDIPSREWGKNMALA